MTPQMKHQIETTICQPLVGQILPTNIGGFAGRELESILKKMNVPMQNGAGADIVIKVLGIWIEVKSRALDAVSPQTMGSINVNDINCAYEDSVLWEKLQYQIRVFTKDCIIVKAELYDFNIPHIQKKFKEAFEYGRDQIIADPSITCTKVSGHWGYFEQVPSSTSFVFRISKNDMPVLERMATSTFTQHFEETV
jgi:hypothetical protein